MNKLFDTPDISVVIPAHREGRLPYRTLRSVRRAVEVARREGIKTEILAVLDRPDHATRAFFEGCGDEVSIHQVSYGDSGPARNHGARAARGKYISFIDADDLYCGNWLLEAFRRAEQSTTQAVWHPHYTVIFQAENCVLRNISSRDPEFHIPKAIEFCHWLPACLVERDVLMRHGFEPCPEGSSFGSEDWHWFCEGIARGIPVEIVDQTCFFYRRRPGSRSADHIQRETTFRPSRLFDAISLAALFPSEETKVAEPAGPAQEPSNEIQEHEPPVPIRRSSAKRIYRERIKPWIPGPVDHALRSTYFALFPDGIKQTVRSLPRTTVRRVRSGALKVRALSRAGSAGSRKLVRGAGRLTRAAARHVLPADLRRKIRARMSSSFPEPLSSGQPAPMPVPELPEWLLEEWRAMHAVEPALFPERSVLERAYYRLSLPDAPMGEAYVDLCRRIGSPRPSHVFLVPWLVRGGSDRTALNYVRALVDLHLAERVVVVATEAADSPWAGRLPSTVPFIEFSKLYRHLALIDQKRLLTRMLLQMAPQVVHNINSWLGYQVFATSGQALSQSSRLYCHVFCGDITVEGKTVGMPYHDLPACFEFLTGVFGDNQTALDHLCRVYGFDAPRMLVHYQPVALGTSLADCGRLSGDKPLRILWAGRLDRQKRVDLLAAIVRQCADRPYQFHIYGYSLLDPQKTDLPAGLNVTYHGPFDGFESLPTERFDVFLYTSQWDGLPNVLLEAMAAGLAVVAPNVGGVGELIIPGQTGYLISPYDDVEAFVAALDRIAAHPGSAAELVHNGYRLLSRRHSWSSFARAVTTAPGYVSPPSKQEGASDLSAA